MSDDNFIPDPNAPTGTGGRDDQNVSPGIDYRAIQQPTELLQPWRIPQSGREEEGEALTHAFDNFGRSAGTWGAKLAQSSGETAGAAAGVQPGFNPKTGLAALSQYGEAFNAAAHVSYVANTQTSVETAVADAENKNSADPNAYMAQATAARDAALKETPGLYQPEMLNMWNRRIAAGQIRVGQQAQTQVRASAVADYETTQADRFRAAANTAAELPSDQQQATIQQTLHDDQTMLNGLVTSGAISPAQATIAAAKAKDNLTAIIHGQYAAVTVDRMMGLAKAGDVEAADRAEQAYLNDPNNSDTDKAAILHDYETQREQFTRLQSQLHANDVAAVGQQLVQGANQAPGQGAYGPQIESQIHQLYKVGAINGEGMAALLDHSMRNQVSSIHDDSSNTLFDAAMHGGPGLDPKNPQIVKDSDAYFKAHVMINGLAPGSDAYAISTASFVRATNIVPPVVRSQIRTGMLSSDPTQAAAAATLAKRIHDANPNAALFDDSESKLSAQIDAINTGLSNGMTPQAAVAAAQHQIDVSPEVAKLRQANYNAAVKANPNNQALQERLNTSLAPHFWNANPPAAPVAMQADYESLVKGYYAQTGDIRKSQDLAAAQVQKSWSTSTVNGSKELLKYAPPEAMVPTIRSSIADTAKAVGFPGDPAQLHLTPSGLTDQSRGRFWQLTYIDQDGVPEALLDQNNRPIQIDLSRAYPDYARQKQALIDSKMDSARKQRAAQQAIDAENLHPTGAMLAQRYFQHGGR